MTKRTNRRSYRKRDRRVWVSSGLDPNLSPQRVAAIITRAGLEQARREAMARADHQAHLSAPEGNLHV